MARAKRHFLPGNLWHITHRCHKRDFLLKFARDRSLYLELLYQAKKRYGLKVLNYMVTSNHVHLLVADGGRGEVISKSMQLVAGRLAQAFNKRRKRSGAYWEDRYHATAIEKSDHLFRCMTYIDLNMVRAGVVDHPSEWVHCGYHEVQAARQRYTIIDRGELTKLTGIAGFDVLAEKLKISADEALRVEDNVRQGFWTESVAVGSRDFVEETKERLKGGVMGRRVQSEGDEFLLREPASSYRAVLSIENGALRPKNTGLLQ